MIPLAGSYYVEALTDEVEAAAWKLIDTIDAMGGSVDAIEEGFIRMKLPGALTNTSGIMEDESKIIVGVNKFQSEDTNKIPGFRINSIQVMQTDKLKALRNKGID